ncbi:hypothetical protein NP233_g4140 [Leucocoprinus birnbaumii]|uniref:Replication protein A OB domain-containing protein n=1 Tax=Leucocoprinus birnbaumii TaxID=56174 RepID=A0AAD5VV73_9AGAR|nr:hypothetical protein NP233_g4140 [Leucocoprinus birnbaumii]
MTTTQLTPNGILGLTQHVEEPSEGLDLDGEYSTYAVLIASDRENIPAFLVINTAHYFESDWDRDWMAYIDRWTAIEPRSASPIWSDPPLIQTPPSNKLWLAKFLISSLSLSVHFMKSKREQSDIIAIVVHVSELDVQTSWYDDVRPCKISKRCLSLLDQSGYWVQATNWDPGASEFSIKPGSIVAFRHVKISGFRGRSISILSATTMHAEPRQYVPETCDALRQWHDEMGSNFKKDLSEFIGQTQFVDKEPVERMPVPLRRD